MINPEDFEFPKGFHYNMEDDEGPDFTPCSSCDGHSACEDFGCAIDLGLSRMLPFKPEDL